MISQREARRLRKRVIELEDILDRERNRWATGWRPGWVNIETLLFSDASFAKVDISRKLGHAVVCVPSEGNKVMLYADRLDKF